MKLVKYCICGNCTITLIFYCSVQAFSCRKKERIFFRALDNLEKTIYRPELEDIM